MSDIPLIVIVGPTGSGKTNLAIRIAKQFDGEVISADSRAVYQGLDIGTAKPTAEEMLDVPHWGIDMVGPHERFTVVDFQRYAKSAIADIRARGHIPILTGGTGLYVDSVVYDYQFPDSNLDTGLRDSLSSLTIDELHSYCENNNIQLPENKQNKRYVVNNIMRGGDNPKKSQRPVPNCIVVGIATEKHKLWSRLEDRASQMWASGLVHEAHRESARYGWGSEAMTGNTYRVVRQYDNGLLDDVSAVKQIAVLDRQLAKRQLTWLKRSEHICWLDVDAAYTYVAQVLAARLNT